MLIIIYETRLYRHTAGKEMKMKHKEIAEVISQESIATGIYSMWLKCPLVVSEAKEGQFISLYCHDGSRILPRPISICEIDKENGTLRIVYRVAGKGTDEFSTYGEGEKIEILGPLGNGFTLQPEKSAMLMAGGIGIPPMVQTAKQLKAEGCADINIVIGYRNAENFLVEELSKYGKVFIATEDGSVGTKGNVMDAIKANDIKADVIYACGPTPMLKAIKNYAIETGTEAWISMEEKMACGIGACLACVCKSKDVDHHTHVNNKRVCKDGPVFNAMEVEL